MAAIAIFALNAGVWFRRGRLLMVSPDSQGTACPMSGRNSTYRSVQISGTGSEFAKHEVKTEIIRLVEYEILPGTKSNMGKKDEWPRILEKLARADIIVFATPIWWSGHSSLIQRMLERLDELNDEIVETGNSEFLNKVGGMVITGGEDGVQNVIAGLANFMVWNGLTLPPACSLSYIGNHRAKTAKGLKRSFSRSQTRSAWQKQWRATWPTWHDC